MRNHQHGFLFLFVPAATQMGLNLIVLPESDMTIKALARTSDEVGNRAGGQETSLRRSMLTGVLATHPK
jgi:hypothetical protein